MHHPIPFHLTKGKTTVTIKMEALKDNTVGGLYGVRTIRTKEIEENATIVDYFLPSGNSLTQHNYESNGGTGVTRGRTWVDGLGLDAISFDMAVNSTAANTITFLYWGGEWDLRAFDIIVDGEVVGSEQLMMNTPGRYFFRSYKIPETLTSGKDKVHVVLSASAGTKVGGFYMVYTSSVPVTDGISMIENAGADADASWYNLCGQRVSRSYKGIVVANGRKFLTE